MSLEFLQRNNGFFCEGPSYTVSRRAQAHLASSTHPIPLLDPLMVTARIHVDSRRIADEDLPALVVVPRDHGSKSSTAKDPQVKLLQRRITNRSPIKGVSVLPPTSHSLYPCLLMLPHGSSQMFWAMLATFLRTQVGESQAQQVLVAFRQARISSPPDLKSITLVDFQKHFFGLRAELS